jgi:ABC-type multidrug transport system ATPase subunit
MKLFRRGHKNIYKQKPFNKCVNLIKLKGVTKQYRKQKVLEDVDLVIESGDILGVIGQSGSGKTTLLNLIAGFITPSDGEVLFTSFADNKERDLHKHINKVKKHIGFTATQFSLSQINSHGKFVTFWKTTRYFKERS